MPGGGTPPSTSCETHDATQQPADFLKLYPTFAGINLQNEHPTMKKLFLIGTLTAVFCGPPLLAQETNLNIAPKTLESYVGQYEVTPGFVITIRKEGERLTAQATGQPRLRLIAQSETDFKISSVDATVTFTKDKEGNVTLMVVHQNGDHEAPKISSEVPKARVAVKIDPKIYDAYVGQYELGAGDVFTVRREGNKLRAQLAGQPSFEVFPESETNFFYKVVDAQLTFVKDTDGKVTKLVLHQNGDKTARKTSNLAPPLKTPDLSKIPARDPKADANLVDLSGKYNAVLAEQWHPDANALPAGGNHLAALPVGIQKLDGTDFDVRGVIQLTGSQAEFAGASFPESQPGIKIGHKCKQLTMLQATGWQTEDGTTIGTYVLHYTGGTQATLNIVYGLDARDWWYASSGEPKEAKSATIAWSGSNPATEASGASLRLFKRTYENPKPDLTIETIDFVSAQSESAPFLIAVTLGN